MFCRTCPDDFGDRLLQALAVDHQVLGAQQGSDGVCRIAPLHRWGDLSRENLPLLPAKKVVLPPQETLWTLEGEDYHPPETPGPLALLGVFSCDLFALDYLDRAFAEDSLYRSRRQPLFLVGTPCLPGEGCFCPTSSAPPPFDLFVDHNRVWAGSTRGRELLEVFGGVLGTAEEAEPPKPSQEERPFPPAASLARLHRESAADPLWFETARRCLSCGACSAVCPTCACFDVVDTVAGGKVHRRRQWDNCFFTSHALVAGGHNFRPTRKERLRFRFEHKFLGFGPLRGVVSCVGCGRCGRNCPVDIDISKVLQALVEREGL
ncbi:4Fe-4S ferredoxin [Desulfuromonas soudanensis]|uniref:4Fe-4S ferredoxin n=1 Tax=Desulfuromonas soudanensis TaxID=1603606 RepID=A0A0M4CYF9_9BACT|nr:4Fe-4S dicluster domain-containing protein [Desulfuromonas soudanensis]ALC17491.1 4Fe-4S ferredoxin [Desulfuromonas soudanensis]